MSFLEIYNEVIRDLLGSGKDDAKHEIRLVSAGSSEVYVTDLTTVSVNNKEQVRTELISLLTALIYTFLLMLSSIICGNFSKLEIDKNGQI